MSVPAVSLDNSIGVFEISLNARTQNFGNQSVREANPAPTCFIFISRTDTTQRRSDFLISQTLFTRVIQRAVIRQDQVRAGTHFHTLRCNRDALAHQSIGFFKKSFRIDHHAVAEHASLALVNDAGRQQVKHEGLITDLNRVSGVVAALIADHDVEPLREQIDDLAFTFVAPLGAYDRYYHRRSELFQTPDSK